jgi:hypothetical protein
MMTPRVLAPHILRALATSQYRGQPLTIEALVAKLKVRKVDVRAAVSALHTQGLVDALTLRLSFQGFAIGTALRSHKLPAIRRPAPAPLASIPPSTRSITLLPPSSSRPSEAPPPPSSRPLKRSAA